MPETFEKIITPSSFQIIKSKKTKEPFYLVKTTDEESFSCWEESLANQLRALQGKKVTVEYTKSEDGKWKNIISVKEEVSAIDKFGAGLENDKQKEYGNVPQEVWEKKDQRIVRMSVLRSAVDWASAQLEADKKKKIKTSDILKVAQVFEQYVQNGKTPQQLKEKEELEKVAEEVFEE